MQDNMVITIGREYGSGGRAIGKMLADKLGIKYYDKELINLVAQESGLCVEALEKHDEKLKGGLFHFLSFGGYSDYMQPSLHQKVFLAQFETIQNLAKRESCVIIGRCADYALRDFDNTTSVFISAKSKDKIKLVSDIDHLNREDALIYLKKIDKKRQKYYNYYSNKKWGYGGTYDLCLNSSKIGYEGCVDTIIEFIEKKKKYLK